ncbi:hypothetical protein MMC25_001867 [Agyrium rufum]|nr:hypothetical protein [Agyrium rufum]
MSYNSSSGVVKYDAIVIGSGQSGTPLALAFAKAERKTALIESTHIGGCCINVGCTPTKTLIASGKIAYHSRRAAEFGVHHPGAQDSSVKIDMEKVRQRKRAIVESFRGGSEGRLQAGGVEVIFGNAAFDSPKSIRIDMNDGSGSRVISGAQIFVNTGERPVIPDLPGLPDVPKDLVLDSTSIQELDVVPRHLIVLGGGYIGLEFAQLFRRLGSDVTVVQRSSQLLTREDPEVAACLQDILVEDGIRVLTGANAQSVRIEEMSDGVSITLEVKSTSETTPIKGSHLLLAAGRRPNTDMLNLETAGITTTSRGHIWVNEYLQTTGEEVFALGDVKGGPAFTHISYDDFRILEHNLLTLPAAKGSSSTVTRKSTKGRIVPYVCYTDPQMAHVGLHEKEARSLHPEANIKIASMPMGWVARALEMDESRGMMKAVVDEDSKLILGFTCLGVEGGEVMAIVQTAMMAGLPYTKLREAVWAHPSLAESLNNLWGNLK